MFQKIDVEKTAENLIQWIKDWFEENGKGCNAVIGISGGKDSSVVAALCVKALGKDRVLGVRLPCGEQKDSQDADLLISTLGIKSFTINIKDIINATLLQFKNAKIQPSEQTLVNLPARIRMSVLYAFSQSHNGRVSCNCNLSEDTVGYSTRYGDDVGDFAPLRKLTVEEVVAIGDYLRLPYELTHKIPADGLQDKTDEDNLGISYEKIGMFLRNNSEGLNSDEIKLITDKYRKNHFKLLTAPAFENVVFEVVES